MSPVVHRAGEGMCAKLSSGHSISFISLLYLLVDLFLLLSTTVFVPH